MEQLNNKKVIYEIISGSTCYGLNTSESDIDIRGVYMQNHKDFIINTTKQVSDKKHDISYMELFNYVKLAAKGSPETIELLFTPKKFVKKCTSEFQKIIDNRKLFMTQRLFYSFSGYAYAQIKKARGQNKKWHLEKKFGNMLEPPQIINYCYFFDAEDNLGKPYPLKNIKGSYFYIVSGLEHCSNVYRLYNIDVDINKNKPTFGFIKNNAITCSSIPKETEYCVCGYVLVNYDAFREDVRGYKQYNEWINNRNPHRWETQLSGKIDYDVKNMLHSVRLLKSGINIFENGEPIIHWIEKDKEFLMNIRNGKFDYDYLIKTCEELNEKLDSMDKNVLPKEPNIKKINDIVYDIYDKYWHNKHNKEINNMDFWSNL